MIPWRAKAKKIYLWMERSRLMERMAHPILIKHWDVVVISRYTPKPIYAHFKAGVTRQVYKGSPYYTGLLSVYVRENRQTIIDKDTGKQRNEIVVRLWVYRFVFGWQSRFYRLHPRWR